MHPAQRYLIIGAGRVAAHFKHYFSLLQIPFDSWHRGLPINDLSNAIKRASHVLILINDDAIQDFITNYLDLKSIMRIHFSGSLVLQAAWGAHPLMTFNKNFYTLDAYQRIPFILDDDAPTFSNLLPGLHNPHVRLNRNLKAKYHALCVLSGNFSCLLWQKFFSSLANEFNMPRDIGEPYFLQQMTNLLQKETDALTGPLARDDKKTIEANLDALKTDPFFDVYQSFITCFSKLKMEEVQS